MFSTDWNDPAIPERMRRRIRALPLKHIHSVQVLNTQDAFDGVGKPIYLVSCYADASGLLCVKYRDGILVVHNSYLTSFIQHIGLAALADQHRQAGMQGVSARGIIASLGKKLLAEQLYAITPSHLARVLFLETILAHEESWRGLIAMRASDEILNRSSILLAQLTSDFLMHHEVGHVGEADRRFDEFTKDFVRRCLPKELLGSVDEENRASIVREATADIFGLNTCLARYSPMLSERTLRDYLRFTARMSITLNLLYAFAADLHRNNVDATYGTVPIERVLTELTCREAVMISYLDEFEFGADTVIARAQDEHLSLACDDKYFSGLWRGQDFTVPPSQSARALAEVLSNGFEQGNFDGVIGALRAPWVLSGPT